MHKHRKQIGSVEAMLSHVQEIFLHIVHILRLSFFMSV